jgi:ribokinase
MSDNLDEANGSAVFDVVGLGYTATDYLAIVPHLPEFDTKLEAECLSVQGGGPVATALVTTNRLGFSSAYIGKVGDDGFGAFMLEELEREGVDVRRVVREKDAESQFAFIMVDKQGGHRTIVWTRGTVSKLRKGEADLAAIGTCKCLLLDDMEVEAAVEAASWAKEAKVPIVLDAGTLREGMRELLPFCDYIAAGREFGAQLTGTSDPLAAARRIHESTGNVSVVTIGEEGCVCVCTEGVYRQRAFKVSAVDTTGAGDVFHGAFAVGILKGWDVPKVLEFSSAVAAMKCRRLGGRPGIPNFQETMAFLKKQSPENW